MNRRIRTLLRNSAQPTNSDQVAVPYTDYACLRVVAQQKEVMVREQAAKAWWIRYVLRRDPERQKTLSLLAAELGDVQSYATHWIALEDAGRSDDRVSKKPSPGRLAALVANLPDAKKIDRDSAWELVDSFRTAKLDIAPREVLQVKLDVESTRAKESKTGKDVPGKDLTGRDPTGRDLTWGKYFDESELESLRTRGGSDLDNSDLARWRSQTIERLARLQWERSEDGRHRRLRSTFRTLLLLWLVPLFAILIGGTVWALRAGNDLASAGFAGALGAATSGAFLLRDELQRVREFRSFIPLVLVQPLIGATFGLVTYLALASGLVAIGNFNTPQPAMIPAEQPDRALSGFALFSFVAGLSEPFFFGLISRLSPGGPADASTNADAAGVTRTQGRE